MDNTDQRGGWDWPHIIPRRLILTAFVVFNLVTGAAIWSEFYLAAPATAHWFILWKAVGGNASGVWFWLISGLFLYSEVVTMVLTMLSNRARLKAAVEKAVAEAVETAVAEAVEKAVAEAVPQAVAEHNRLWREWNERREAAAREGRGFTEPPPEPPQGNGKNV